MRHYLMLNSKLGKKAKNCEQEITWIVLQYFFFTRLRSAARRDTQFTNANIL